MFINITRVCLQFDCQQMANSRQVDGEITDIICSHWLNRPGRSCVVKLKKLQIKLNKFEPANVFSF